MAGKLQFERMLVCNDDGGTRPFVGDVQVSQK